MRQACATDAGFFTLWKVPRRALGVDLRAAAKEQRRPVSETFNRTVIAETGIVGVHFDAVDRAKPEPLVRYAVCADVLAPSFQKRFEEQLDRLKPSY